MQLSYQEVQKDSIDRDIIQDAVMIQSEYGKYLFDEIYLKESRNDYFESLTEFPNDTFQRPNGVYFVVNGDTNKAVGAIGLGRVDKVSCEMRRFFVLPNQRGNGIGAQLVNFIIQEAKKMHYVRMYLETQPEMIQAIHLYEKCGFKRIAPYCHSLDPSTIHFALDIK